MRSYVGDSVDIKAICRCAQLEISIKQALSLDSDNQQIGSHELGEYAELTKQAIIQFVAEYRIFQESELDKAQPPSPYHSVRPYRELSDSEIYTLLLSTEQDYRAVKAKIDDIGTLVRLLRRLVKDDLSDAERAEIKDELSRLEKTADDIRTLHYRECLERYYTIRTDGTAAGKLIESKFADALALIEEADAVFQTNHLAMVNAEIMRCVSAPAAIAADSVKTRVVDKSKKKMMVTQVLNIATNPKNPLYKAVNSGIPLHMTDYNMAVTIAPTAETGNLTWRDRELLDTVFTLYKWYGNSLYIPLKTICRELHNKKDVRITDKELAALEAHLYRLSEIRMTLVCGGWTDRYTGEWIDSTIKGHLMEFWIYDETINGQPNTPTLFLRGTPLLFHHAEMLNHVITYPSELKDVPDMSMNIGNRQILTYMLWRIGVAKNKLYCDVQKKANKAGKEWSHGMKLTLDVRTIMDQAGTLDNVKSAKAKERKKRETKQRVTEILEHWTQVGWIVGFEPDAAHKERFVIKIRDTVKPNVLSNV